MKELHGTQLQLDVFKATHCTMRTGVGRPQAPIIATTSNIAKRTNFSHFVKQSLVPLGLGSSTMDRAPASWTIFLKICNLFRHKLVSISCPEAPAKPRHCQAHVHCGLHCGFVQKARQKLHINTALLTCPVQEGQDGVLNRQQ